MCYLPIGGSRVACRSRRPDACPGRSPQARPAGPRLPAGRSSPLWPAVRGGAHFLSAGSSNADESLDPC